MSAFQAARGLGVDGIAGPLTLAALRKPSAVLYPGTGYAGHGSGRVRVLQRHLAKAGFAPGPIDGRYGPRTERAVSRFQTAHGLGVDGIAGPQTLARLGNQPLTRQRHPARSPRPAGPRHRANRRPHHRQRSRPHTAHRQPRRPAAPRTLAPVGHATSTPGIGLLVMLIAPLVGLGLAAIWIVRRRRKQRYAGVDQAASGAARSSAANAIAPHPDPSTADNPATVPIPEMGGTVEADRAFRQALLLEERGDQKGAIGAYQQADRLGHGAAACNLGALLHQDGELAAAEASFRRAAQRGDAHGAFNLAVLQEERGDLTGAMAAYQQADRLGHGAGACNLGVLLEEHGDLAAAEASFRRAAQRGDGLGAFNLAVLLEGRGDREGALRAYEQAARLRDQEATVDLARAAVRELRSQIDRHPVAARKGGGHNGD